MCQHKNVDAGCERSELLRNLGLERESAAAVHPAAAVQKYAEGLYGCPTLFLAAVRLV